MRKNSLDLLKLYKQLYREYGPQGWWPVLHKLGIRHQISDIRAFEICVGAILTQNTAWINVEKAIKELDKAQLLSPDAMRKVPTARLQKAIKSAGYYNEKAKKLKIFVRFLDEEGGFTKLSRLSVPKLREALLSVWGIGPETADSIILYAFKKPIFVIDAYTKRLLDSFGIHFKTYDEYQLFFEERLPRSVKLWSEYHALIVQWAKQKNQSVVTGLRAVR